MTIAIFAAVAIAAGSAPAVAGSCTGDQRCVSTGAAQLFELADRLFAAGDSAGAEQILLAITQDKHPELRAEAWFRIAAVREKNDDLPGAASALRNLLTEQPSAGRARLELARILSRLGQNAAARRELSAAQHAGLPPEVEATVRQFSTSLAPARRRGLSIEIAGGPDSNINRATASRYVDTIIAPFELDADARRRSGLGLSANVQAWSQNRLGPIDLLSRAGVSADLFDRGDFNDIQLSADSGPQWDSGWGRIRAAVTAERRWFGGNPYARGLGGQLGWQIALGQHGAAEMSIARVHQSVDRNRLQDGWRTSATLALTRLIGTGSSVRATLRWGALDARIKPESLRIWGIDGLVATRAGPATLFAQAGYTKTRGLAPIFLFGERRQDRRIDLVGGAIFSTLSVAGFSPLVRFSHTRSNAHIALYDYTRDRLDFGITHSF